MTVVVVDQEMTLEALAARILKAKASKKATQEAIAGIRKANPGRDLDTLSRGQIVIVPPLGDARPGAGDIVGPPVDTVLAAVNEAVAAMAEAAAAAREAGLSERSGVAEILRAPEVKRAAARDATLKAHLSELKAALGDDDKAAAEHAEGLDRALGTWGTDLDALRALLS